MFFFFKDPATTEIYTYGHTLSLHDALPIYASFEDVSRSLGRGPWHTAAHAVLPQIQPALGSGAILVLGHMLAEFGALAMLRVQTFTTAIFERSEEHTSELQSLMRISYAVFCLKKQNTSILHSLSTTN